MIPCRVERLDKPAPDVAVMGLRLPMNENFRFLAGQYIDFLLKDGKRRSYSLATRPSPRGVTALELHVRHTPGGLFTDHVFAKPKVRDMLRFEGPLGTFYLREDSDKPIVMVASGTGFAPIKAIVEHALEKKICSRPITLYWGCRAEARPLPCSTCAQSWTRTNSSSSRCSPTRRSAVERPHRLRAPRRDGGLSRHVRRPGVRLRRAGHGRRRRARDFSAQCRLAARGVLRRFVPDRGRQGRQLHLGGGAMTALTREKIQDGIADPAKTETSS